MGALYIVSTPVGNLKDITLRAIEILKSVDYILCEDTRITGKLLARHEIFNKMISLTDFNESAKTPSIVSDLVSGKNIALVSDAGTPLISDPGFKLVREAILKNIKVESILGPTAVVAALTISGLPPDKFLFIGYPPKGGGKRITFFHSLFLILANMKDHHLKATTIFYESPYRLIKSLNDILNIFGDIDVVVCREMTKLHEEIRREKISDSINHFLTTKPLGEFVVLF